MRLLDACRGERVRVCIHEHLTHAVLDFCFATALVMSADGSWSVCTMNICHIAVLCYALQRQSCHQMVHGVFCTHEHLTSLFSRLYACHSADHVSRWFSGVLHHEHLPVDLLLCACHTALIMSADGLWSVCTHEHLSDRCSLLCACYSASHVSRGFMRCLHS
jgi:hypothetical protein